MNSVHNYAYKNLICNHCGITFDSKTYKKTQKYCSKSCAGKNNQNAGRFKKGQPSWNKGTNLSGMSGKKVSPETKEKMRAVKLGELAPNWKGGITDENYRIRRSGKYKDWRTAVFERDNYTCQHCGDKSVKGNRVILNADHINQFAFYPEFRFDIDKGRTICVDCHKKTPTYGNQSKEAILESTNETFNSLSPKEEAA